MCKKNSSVLLLKNQYHDRHGNLVLYDKVRHALINKNDREERLLQANSEAAGAV